MGTHIQKNKSAIYQKASRRVIRDLDKLFESNRKEMEKSAHYLVDGLENDFRMIISSSEMIEESEVAREHIRGVLYEVDSKFEKILCMDRMDVDTAQSSQNMPQTVSAVPVAPGAPRADNSEIMVIDS